jgi:O-antigen ligase/tetratricopeptide (TPR) repeat protein
MIVTPLIVTSSLYFPFITGKGFFFRTLIELAAVLYICLAVRDRSYIPKKSMVVYSLSTFLGVMLIATLLSQNPLKSFWSDYERMEGYVTLLHLGAYFIMLATLFGKKIWSVFLNLTLVSSVVVGFYGLLDLIKGTATDARIAGTLGNSSYLGVYALLCMFISLFMAVRAYKTRPLSEFWWWLVGYAALFVFNGYIMYHTGTRGAFVGCAVGLFLAALLVGIFEKNHKALRKTAIVLCAIVVVAVAALGLTRNTSYVQNSPLLSRFAAIINPNVEQVFQEEGYDRTLLWGTALQGFEARPIFGWGQESFNYVFAQYYNPKMYDQEQWFDRSHNVFLDWLIAGGALGLLSYLSLFAAIIYLLWKKGHGHEEDAFNVSEKAVMTGLLAAYFIHNLFVFDNLISYLFFFAILAYVHHRSTTHVGEARHHTPLISSKGIQAGVAVVVVVLAVWIWHDGVQKAYAESRDIIIAGEAVQVAQDQPVTAAQEQASYNAYQAAFAENTFGNYEARERLSDEAATIVAASSTDPTVKAEFASLTDEQYAKQLAETPKDPRYYLFYGLYQFQIGDIDDSIKNFQAAVNLSPTKQSFLTQLGAAYFQNKQYDLAVASMKQAYELDTDDKDALTLYSAVLIYSGQATTSDALIAQAQANGVDVSSDDRILSAYLYTKDYTRLRKVAAAIVAAAPNDPSAHVTAAGIYFNAGDKTTAISELETAEALDPTFKAQGDQYIEVIKSGGNPGEDQSQTQAQTE